MNAPTTKTTFNLARKALLLAAVLVGALAGGLPNSAVAQCAFGEAMILVSPVVTVIEGPGDAAIEQARWSSVEGLFLNGLKEISLGGVAYAFEVSP